MEQEPGSSVEENEMKARALVELFSYIENCVEDGNFYFKFSLLHQLFETPLQEPGIKKKLTEVA